MTRWNPVSSFTTPTKTLRCVSRSVAFANCSWTWDMRLKTSIAATSPFRVLALLSTLKGLLSFTVLSAYSSAVGRLCKISSGGSSVLKAGGARWFIRSSFNSNSQMMRSLFVPFLWMAHHSSFDLYWGERMTKLKTSGPFVAGPESSCRMKSICSKRSHDCSLDRMSQKLLNWKSWFGV